MKKLMALEYEPMARGPQVKSLKDAGAERHGPPRLLTTSAITTGISPPGLHKALLGHLMTSPRTDAAIVVGPTSTS